MERGNRRAEIKWIPMGPMGFLFLDVLVAV